MASLTKAKQRGKGGRRGGGRPRETDRERYPNGRVKPVKPNPEVLARRALICADPTMSTCPLDAAFANGWISREERAAGMAYLSVHARAGFYSPSSAALHDAMTPSSVAEGIRPQVTEGWACMSKKQIDEISWTTFSHKEIAAVWDSAMRDIGRIDGTGPQDDFAARANQRWRALNAAMTSLERTVVDSFVVREEWPQWIAERLAGRMKTVHELKRDVLISGLRTIQRTLRKPKTPAVRDLVLPDPLRPVVRVEVSPVVDDDGNVIGSHERVIRG